jgi:GntR family transcriptional regulator, sialic acid-inducible nan operon repressor
MRRMEGYRVDMDFGGAPIRRRKLYEEVAARIEAKIRAGGYAAGDFMPAEREIMEQFGVGRSTVREALLSLEKMGLITIRSGERARIATPTPRVLIKELSGAARLLLAQKKGVDHFQDARLLLETGLARLAALRASPSHLAALAAALAANRRAIGNPEESLRTDVAFHYAIAASTGNPIFTSLHDGVVEWLTEQRDISLRVPAAARDAYAAHERIYNAIAGRNPLEAQAAMQDHLDQVARYYWIARKEAASQLSEE